MKKHNFFAYRFYCTHCLEPVMNFEKKPVFSITYSHSQAYNAVIYGVYKR